MQKCPNWNILSPSGVQVWDVLVIQGELRSKYKMFLELHVRRGLFYAKTPNLQFCIWLTSDQPIWWALAPQGDLLLKNWKGQKGFRI